MRHHTLAEPHELAAEPIKGSRFYAIVAPIADEQRANDLVRATAARFADASHVCFAWRLRPAESRVWDAGEPRGSAGRPILQQLEGHDVLFTVAIVVRWYGGTPLGVGGLMRAYGGAAGRALDRAPRIERVDQVERSLTFAYDDTNAVHATLTEFGGQITEVQYDVRVTLRVQFPAEVEARLNAQLRDRTAGRVTLLP